MSIELGTQREQRIRKPKHAEKTVKPSSDLHFQKSSTIFEHTMAEIVENPNLDEVAKLSHREKVLRAMHGGSKPEAKFTDEEFDFSDLIQGVEKKDPESLATKLGPALGFEGLHPFRTADKGKEHIVLENKDQTKLVKVDKSSADSDEEREARHDKAKVYKVLEEFAPGRFPHSELFEKEGETGVIVDKVKTHPKFEEARTAAKNGDHTLWNEIINKENGYFSEVLDELNAVGINLWDTPSLDADERDNFVTDENGKQVFVDDVWLEGKEVLAVKDNMLGHMKENPEKYPAEQQDKVKAALQELEKPEETTDKNSNRKIKNITRRIQHTKNDYAA